MECFQSSTGVTQIVVACSVAMLACNDIRGGSGGSLPVTLSPDPPVASPTGSWQWQISCNDCVLKRKAEIKCLSSLLPNQNCWNCKHCFIPWLNEGFVFFCRPQLGECHILPHTSCWDSRLINNTVIFYTFGTHVNLGRSCGLQRGYLLTLYSGDWAAKPVKCTGQDVGPCLTPQSEAKAPNRLMMVCNIKITRVFLKTATYETCCHRGKTLNKSPAVTLELKQGFGEMKQMLHHRKPELFCVRVSMTPPSLYCSASRIKRPQTRTMWWMCWRPSCWSETEGNPRWVSLYCDRLCCEEAALFPWLCTS